jgi:hypothetical protein
MKNPLIFTVLLSLSLISCGRNSNQETKSLGETLEASFSTSSQEQQARSLAEQQKQKLQAQQRQLQEERLKSYSGGSPGQNP